MIHYKKNTAIVLDALVKCQYDKRSILLTKQCYVEFKDYMEGDTDALFSLKKALDWCEKKVAKAYRNQFKNAIYRFS